MEKRILDNYIVSLLAKPFVVLSGNSGTGKTRLALRLAENLEKKSYKVNTWVQIDINKQGGIVSKTEEEIRELCIDSNVFIAHINDKEFEIQIEMSAQIICINPVFWNHINDDGYTKINLGTAVRIPVEKRHALIPVGADWTDTRSLIGYINPFGPEGKTIYVMTPMLELLLRALHPTNKYLPHFIILDEMNLSHVERYFSSFLSAMEAARSTSETEGISLIELADLPIILETLQMSENVDEKILDSAKLLMDDNKSITLPPNIFIVGTVNVDETTYMFSPKVLDRAHIIELETEHPSNYFNQKPGEEDVIYNRDTLLNHFKSSIEYREIEYQGNNLLENLESKWGDRDGFNLAKREMEILLSGMYSILKIVNFDFGYRTFKETIEYLYFATLYNQSNSDWIDYMDNVLLQKVLPKLHGNRRQLSDVLEMLIKFLKKETFEDLESSLTVKESSEEYNTNTDTLLIRNNLDLPRSIAKLERMRSSLNNIGYTSFIS
ncbi:hypothetical protein [Alkalicoccobacillus plakortidis]|uniref:Dynein-related subfamily AAA family protein n=1 Tax=Alkalicoccobacillus plakortidis TaxID=444060 RepID=A0ABT0XKI1_9BACI|nr:hypothetical protein [Alkalicoccobacillus plakortidis]MCM2676413.1 hypothetical protein [Alkalicoccobacillus plakortidis]